MGYVILEAKDGQVLWHNHGQEEVCMVLQGRGEICVGAKRGEIKARQAVFRPPRKFHQLTNTGDEPMHVMYVYCPGGAVSHWRQELEETLPAAGHAGIPPLPPRNAVSNREGRESRRKGVHERREKTDRLETFGLRAMEEVMKVHSLGIVMNGVTGRMGVNQHLFRSIKAIIDQGGVRTDAGEEIMPVPVLVGRNRARLEALAARAGVPRFTTDLDAALADPANQIYFDATVTGQRPGGLRKAIAARKHLYCEKPIAGTTAEALALSHEATAAGLKHGVVQDKLLLPGLLQLKQLITSGFFGRILSVRGEFGYWVFPGEKEELQRPSWNYRREAGGGIIVDMFCHWRYILDGLSAR